MVQHASMTQAAGPAFAGLDKLILARVLPTLSTWASIFKSWDYVLLFMAIDSLLRFAFVATIKEPISE